MTLETATDLRSILTAWAAGSCPTEAVIDWLKDHDLGDSGLHLVPFDQSVLTRRSETYVQRGCGATVDDRGIPPFIRQLREHSGNCEAAVEVETVRGADGISEGCVRWAVGVSGIAVRAWSYR